MDTPLQLIPSSRSIERAIITTPTKDLIVTAKVLLMVSVIAGLAAICIFCPPLGTTLAAAIAIKFAVVWIAAVFIGTAVGFILACENNDGGNIFGNMLSYTGHDGKDCALFLFGTIGLPIAALFCILTCGSLGRHCVFGHP